MVEIIRDTEQKAVLVVRKYIRNTLGPHGQKHLDHATQSSTARVKPPLILESSFLSILFALEKVHVSFCLKAVKKSAHEYRPSVTTSH